jgi:glucose-6-phosphate 1-dehydrogenase
MTPSNTVPTTPTLPDPFTLVVFGASGDLTRRKLIPAIFQLWCQELLPTDFIVMGFARSEKTDAEFRAELAEAIRATLDCAGKPIDEARWEQFTERLFYCAGQYDDSASFAQLEDRLATIGAPANRLYYLATPPNAFPQIIEQLGDAGMARRDQDTPWARVVIEKPFGTDLETCHALNELVRTVFDEKQIFRIDHYLGKETVQNILVLRFGNSVFEHVWSHHYIDHVQITVAESLSVGTRGGYYDHAGALRDMVQNHMLHLLSLVAMEPPSSLDADDIRNEKVKVLSALRGIPWECAANGVVRAQYDAGTIEGEPISAYRDTDGVAPHSRTETFVAFKTYVDNWRWEGVPFYMRTGKALPKRCTEISIHFAAVPRLLFNRPETDPLAPNVLTLRIQPNEGISFAFQAKVPGHGTVIKPLKMDFDYSESFGTQPPDAYERLLLDAAIGDATLFTRGDEVEQAWRFVTPVLEGCSGDACPTCLPTYPAGSWGPPEADALIREDKREWHLR